jgi:LmbE family N-acetylglucosaminyl deacetylase
MLLAAHPDDETIGLGAQLHRLGRLHIVHLTNGAPQDGRDAAAHGYVSVEDYAIARRAEFRAALAAGECVPARTECLGIADQDAAYRLTGIVLALADLIGKTQPEAIITHPYEGGHPDHDAAAFAAYGACRLTERDRGWRPDLIEMTSYHSEGGRLSTGHFLPNHSPGVAFALSDADRLRKRRMFDCFRSQRAMLGAFEIGIERLRPAPHYDFGEPPHDGPLYYEQFDWGIDGATWRTLARHAAEILAFDLPHAAHDPQRRVSTGTRRT